MRISKNRKLPKIDPDQISLADIDDFYSERYGTESYSANSNSVAHKFLHSALERGMNGLNFEKVLEVGGNRGEHLPFIQHGFINYLCTDVNNIQNNEILSKDSRIQFLFANVENLHFENESFDRVIVTCLFHHLKNPDIAAREIRRVTKKDGIISIALPHDPGLLYRFLRGITTLKNARQNNFYEAIQIIHAREHRNHFLGLRKILQVEFNSDDVSFRSYPVNRPCFNLNALTVYNVTVRK
jgi:phosphatidylethanolamine/phosphatidyl-N-methylethanolamine N-methyltransferase